jgi:glucose/arabinose dehydrogenase
MHAASAGVNPSYPAPFFYSTQTTFGFLQPIGMAVAPDGRLFITDNAGIVWTSKGAGAKATKLFDLSGHVNEEQDRGLVSVAVDKNYAFNRYIYLAYTFEDRTKGELEAEPSLSLLPKTQRLVRVTVPPLPDAETVTLKPEDEQVILGSYSSDPPNPGVPFSTGQACPQPSDLVGGDWSTANSTDCIPSDSIEHTIDSVRVDPADGTLWVSVGDGGSGGSTLDPNAWRSQRSESYSGKLLHIATDGKGLSGHPFCPSEEDLTKVCTKVYAKGFRNPFRFFFRPSPDGRPTVADAGWSTREELDLAEAGKNYGWPCREGKIATPTWSGEPQCEAISPSAFTEPVYDYHPEKAGGAILGGVSYTGTGGAKDYPAEYKGAIFFSDFVTNQVLYLKLNEAGTAVAPGYPKVFADDLMAVDWATAANGDLMYVDIGFGPSEFAQIRRISYDAANVPPEAVVSADKTFGPLAGGKFVVKFNASKSSDGNGDELNYKWDFTEDGETDSTKKEPEWTFTKSVNTDVTLTVDDGKGTQDTDFIEIFAGDAHAPEPAFDSGPTTYEDGEPIAITASATDLDQGSLGASALSWKVKLDHAGSHIHPIAEKEGVGSVNFETDTAHDAPSTYIVELTAEDSRGLETTTTRVLTPETSLVRIDSSPQGAPITYGGVEQAAPYEKQSTIGLVTTISAGSSFSQAGSPFEFDSWSDGGARIHNLVVPDQDVTLTAKYHEPGAEPQPQPQPEPEGPPADESSAHLSFDARHGLVARKTLKGTAEDPSGVQRVEIALQKAKKQGGHCLWWSRQRGGFAARPASCAKPAFMRAQIKGGETVQWTLALGGKLAPGHYLLVFRTVDGADNVGAGPNGAKQVQLRVK